MEVSGVPPEADQVSGKKQRNRNLNIEPLRFGACNLIVCNYYVSTQQKICLINGWLHLLFIKPERRINYAIFTLHSHGRILHCFSDVC